MSIIHDALKKVQQTNNAGPSTPPPYSQEPSQEPAQQPRPQDKISIPLLVAAICAVIAMLFAALPVVTPKKISTAPAQTTQAPVAPVTVQPVQEAPAAVVKPQEPPPPSSDTMSKAIANAMAVPTTPALPVQKIIDPNDPLSGVQIEGVMDMGGKKAALINGNVYEEGQTIYGRIITEITFDTLTVIENGQKRTLPIKP